MILKLSKQNFSVLLHAISTVQRGFLLFCQISLAVIDLILGRGGIGIFRFESMYFVLPLTFAPNQQTLFYQEGVVFSICLQNLQLMLHFEASYLACGFAFEALRLWFLPLYVQGTSEGKSAAKPREEPSLSDSRAAYQEFLIASRNKQEEKETKEALFERVERKEDKKEMESENLEVQEVSLDELWVFIRLGRSIVVYSDVFLFCREVFVWTS